MFGRKDDIREAGHTKDITINNLDEEAKKAKEQIESLKKDKADLTKNLSACHKELELFYLQAIGNAMTVKQVEAIRKRYNESELGKDGYWLKIKGLRSSIGTLSSFYPMLEETTTFGRAAKTKIKRLNRERIKDMCDWIYTENDNAVYARHMMAVLKDVIGKEVDGAKILEARKLGLDAMGVFKSMLSVYGVEQDSVM